MLLSGVQHFSLCFAQNWHQELHSSWCAPNPGALCWAAFAFTPTPRLFCCPCAGSRCLGWADWSLAVTAGAGSHLCSVLGTGGARRAGEPRSSPLLQGRAPLPVLAGRVPPPASCLRGAALGPAELGRAWWRWRSPEEGTAGSGRLPGSLAAPSAPRPPRGCPGCALPWRPAVRGQAAPQNYAVGLKIDTATLKNTRVTMATALINCMHSHSTCPITAPPLPACTHTHTHTLTHAAGPSRPAPLPARGSAALGPFGRRGARQRRGGTAVTRICAARSRPVRLGAARRGPASTALAGPPGAVRCR